MTKEEKIKEAWGSFYTDKVGTDGWLDINPKTYSNDELFDRLKFNSERNSIRPKSLQGIGDNNGWVKIESPKQLPLIDFITEYHLHDGESTWISVITLFMRTGRDKVTHYRPIEKPKLPIY